MILVRECLGLALASIYLACGLMVMAVAAAGIDNVLGWQHVAGLLVLSLTFRINIFALIGSFLFAHFTLGISSLESLVFALPALAFMFPLLMRDLLRLMIEQRRLL